MNWKYFRKIPWIDSRSMFVSTTPRGGTLLDIGSSNGETLCHIRELRPDLKLFATDVNGDPEKYPRDCLFFRGDIQKDKLPWADESMDSITCMHVVEHLHNLQGLFSEAVRLLKPEGRIYIETPHPKTSTLPGLQGRAAGIFTMNFYDDPTHVAPVSIERLASYCREYGLQVLSSGISRNLLFAAANLVYTFLPPSRRKYTAKAHWIGWFVYLIARKLHPHPSLSSRGEDACPPKPSCFVASYFAE